MSVHDLLAEVERYGGRLILDGENVKVRAPAPLPDELMARLRAHKAELLQVLPDENEKPVEAQAPRQPDAAQAPAGDRTGRVRTHYGAGYRHPDGRVEHGQPEPTPPPAVGWPADLNNMLRRVSVAFEWSQQDVADFRQWARRSPEGLADAAEFLRHECDKLPAPGLSERRRAR